jgi:DNA-binding MarR family transcriptional regulator
VSAIASQPVVQYQALIQLIRTAETLWNASRVLFSRWDLSTSQFNVLNLLHDLPEGLSQTDLSRALLMHRSNVTGLVDRLEARGLVQRRESPADRRAYRVSLTPRARQLMAEILPHYYRAASEVWNDIPAERAASIHKDLEHLCVNAQQMADRLADAASKKP